VARLRRGGIAAVFDRRQEIADQADVFFIRPKLLGEVLARFSDQKGIFPFNFRSPPLLCTRPSASAAVHAIAAA
jgi:hypothetical protein